MQCCNAAVITPMGPVFLIVIHLIVMCIIYCSCQVMSMNMSDMRNINVSSIIIAIVD